ncbi:MAG TPA: type II toxin-antitoxin system VapC family toxin [Solirubrobacteraceae bacterium]
MRLLLDTHTLLALLSTDFPLSREAQTAMERPDAELIASAVNVWEIAIKRSVGKLTAPKNLIERVSEAGAELLSITARHANAVADLPVHHRDPFDRLLIAQARLEGCAIVTRDPAFAAYGVPVVW